MESKEITAEQAYKIALDTLRIYKEKWKTYVQEEVRLQSTFEEE